MARRERRSHRRLQRRRRPSRYIERAPQAAERTVTLATLDVRRLLLEPETGPVPFVLVLQTTRTADLATVIVAPVARGAPIIERLTIPVRIGSETFVALIHELATFQRRDIGELITTLDAAADYQIGLALDALLFGA